MRVRWSQLVYRVPGSDNAVGLARVLRSTHQAGQGDRLRFCEDASEMGEEEVGYLALLPLARGIEDELDEWVEVDPDVFLERDPALWGDGYEDEEGDATGFWSHLRTAWQQWRALFAPNASSL